MCVGTGISAYPTAEPGPEARTKDYMTIYINIELPNHVMNLTIGPSVRPNDTNLKQASTPLVHALFGICHPCGTPAAATTTDARHRVLHLPQQGTQH